MKLLIDDAKAVEISFAIFISGKNTPEMRLVESLLTDRRTMLATIKELKEVIRDRDSEIKDFYRIQP